MARVIADMTRIDWGMLRDQKQALLRACDRAGTDDRLAMLTVWLPQWGFGGFGPGKMEYQWPVARLDQAEWYENEQMPIRAGYGLPVNRYEPTETNLSCSCFFLVGPDGKIVARDTIAGDQNGAKIKAAIAEALGKK